MAVTAFTKTGSKAASSVKLDKTVFGVTIDNHVLLQQAYIANLSNQRTNNATTKTRTQVRGGGRKPWRQKGTGRARAGSIRSPLWRGGGVMFGPDGTENHVKKLTTAAKRTALKQALTIAQAEKKFIVIEDFVTADGKTKDAKKLLDKIGAERRTLIVVAEKSDETARATNNLANTDLITATYLSVYKVLNADTIIMTKAALENVTKWLGGIK